MTDMDLESTEQKQGPDFAAKIAFLLILLKGVWYRKRYIMASMWTVCLLGWAAVSAMPNQYETTTQFVADTRSILKPLLEGIAVQDNPEEEIRIVSQTLLSRPNLEDIAQKTDLHLTAQDENAYEGLLKRLKEEIEIKGTPGTNLYSISYSNPSADTAKAVVEITLKKFIDTISSQSRTDTVSAKDFLDKQIAEYQARLTDSEEKLAEFKRRHQQHLPSRDSDYYNELAKVRQAIENTKFAIKELNAQLSGLRGRFLPANNGASSAGGADVAAVPTQYDELRKQLELNLEQLRLTYTDKHPRVQETISRLDLVKSQQKKARESILDNASRGQLSGEQSPESSAIQEFALDISRLEAERDAMVARLAALEEKQSSLSSNLDVIPEVEKQLAALTRDYDNNRQYYAELLKRRDSAEITGSADTDTQSVKFQVMEPPMRAIKPVGPPRILLYIAVFLLSVGVGVAIAFLMSQINPVVINQSHLERMVGKSAIIGQVVDVEHQKHRRKLWVKALVFSLSTLVLIGMMVTLIGHEVIYDQSPMLWLK